MNLNKLEPQEQPNEGVSLMAKSMGWTGVETPRTRLMARRDCPWRRLVSCQIANAISGEVEDHNQHILLAEPWIVACKPHT